MTRVLRLIALFAAVALLTACADEGEDVALSNDGEATEEAEEPTEEPTEDEDATDDGEVDDETDEESDPEPADEEQWIAVFVVRDVAGHLWVESDHRLLPEPTQAVAGAAMEELFGAAPEDPGLTAPAGTAVEVLSVALDDGLLIVDVSDAIHDAATGAGGEEAFRQALAYTGTQFDTVDAVELRVDGEAITELWGHVDWSDPATPDPFARAPIDVDRPRYGETVAAGPLTVEGTSLTFESTVELDLLDPSAGVAEETFTTAAQPDVDQRGPFSHTFDTEVIPPGTWTIRVREPDPSGGEGRAPYTADIAVEVE